MKRGSLHDFSIYDIYLFEMNRGNGTKKLILIREFPCVY